jgi:hypothetical protein
LYSLPVLLIPPPLAEVSCTVSNFFSFVSFGNRLLKTRIFKSNFIYREKKVTIYNQGKSQIQERPKKILSLHSKLILDMKTVYKSNKKKMIKAVTKPNKHEGEDEKLISSVTTLDSKAQFSTKITKHTKESFQGKR